MPGQLPFRQKLLQITLHADATAQHARVTVNLQSPARSIPLRDRVSQQISVRRS